MISSQNPESFHRLVLELTTWSKARSPFSCSHECHQPRPSVEAVVDLVEKLRAVLFPGFFNGSGDLTSATMDYFVGSTLERIKRSLKEQLQRGLCFVGESCDVLAHCEPQAEELTHRFLQKLPDIQRMLISDADAAFLGDPASISTDEVIFCYPGLFALICHRIAHELYTLNVPIIPRMISEHAHSATGIDIHPGASLGRRLFMDHGTGIVIGETCVIGDNVRIYQGVTLGAKSFPLDEDGHPIKGIPRHPIIEDDVTIYAGATILGRINIGRGALIGGNVWLTRSVPAETRVTQAQASQEMFHSGSGI